MKKLFICLANSKKFTQRCIAGIELAKSLHESSKYQIAKQENKPAWIRPVSSSEKGEVALQLVEHIKLLDIVEINVISSAAQGYQSENVLFNNQPLKVVDKISEADKTESLIDKLLTKKDSFALFGNTGNSVHINDIGQLNYSLVFIKPNNVHIYQAINIKGNPQIRACFFYGTSMYNLPITDIDFEEKYNRNPNVLQAFQHIYFTISLGIEFKEQHYKLIAGILYF